MRATRPCTPLILLLASICVPALAQTETQQKTAVTGKLIRVAAIGGESTGWAIQLEAPVAIDSKPADSVEVDYSDAKKLEGLENKRVMAKGKLSHRHGVETGDRAVLDISSIKEARPK
jgi:hypothetical protein